MDFDPPFNLQIKNIGKLPDGAKLRIGRFTVLAGPNNTGKSFVSKILYSLFDAMNANPFAVQMRRMIKPALDDLKSARREVLLAAWHEEHDHGPVEKIDSLIDEILQMEKQADQCSTESPEELDGTLPEFANRAKEARALIPDLSQYFPPTQRNLFSSPGIFNDNVVGYKIDGALSSLQNSLSAADAKKFITDGIAHRIKENLLQNFQASDLIDLQRIEKRPAEVFIEYIGNFSILNEDIILQFKKAGLRQLQRYSKVIYLESPIYWKLKDSLENIRISPRYQHARRAEITGIPGYFYDLMHALRPDYTGEMDFPKLYEKLTGVLGGKFVISETGKIVFRENDRNFPLTLTATGVTNLGILALLIERKILDKDSFVFIDEPEAHLHPAWQVVMAETLFELAKSGAHIVVATHSPDILKWLEVHIKKHSEDAKFVALNKFPPDAAESEEESFDDKMAAIKQELTKPFADLYMEGL
ncbi:MAG: ATP-binding protein [Gammaproteobacteria bacterium]|nr:ATP-binding protein [Gammaproteobacteria bacterium]